MKKYYGQIIKNYAKIAYVAAALMIICGALFYLTENKIVAAAEVISGVIIIVSVIALHRQRRENVRHYLSIISRNSGAVSSNIIGSCPFPVAIAHIDGSVCWYNNKFAELFDNASLYDVKLETIINDIKWGSLLKASEHYEKKIRIGDSHFTFTAKIVRNKSGANVGEEDKFSVYIYLTDRTAEVEITKMYNNEKTDVAIINIDNYDDILQRLNDTEQQQIITQIRRCVNEWAKEGSAIVKATDRDRYYVFFEHRYLPGYVDKKFDILYKVRKVGEDIKQPVSISIGIGIGGNLPENDSYARSALDMALGRGGDQVSIKDDTQYKFYGSKARDYERSTRVKTRAFAFALKDFITKSDKVIFMGHSGADYDSFGSAIGLQRAVRTMNKTPYIIYDNNSPAIDKMYASLQEVDEYKGMFISGDEALEKITPDTLLIVLDTNRPSMLPYPVLLEKATKIIIIDHHRRSTDFINPCSLIYHEPYASSTCEMATELLEYMNLGSSITPLEAECLYTGILMDTKNFMIKTGVRTFEAASYLKRLGLNTTGIKHMFNVNKEEYDHRADIVKTAQVVAQHISVARCYENVPNIRMIASQAADEMLNIGDTRASVVVYPIDNAVGISARSLGDINVQLLMEYLGGGGHSTVAGAQVADKSIDDVIQDVIEAVNEYLKNNAE